MMKRSLNENEVIIVPSKKDVYDAQFKEDIARCITAASKNVTEAKVKDAT